MWRIDPGSLRYAEELGRLLAELHAVPADEVAGTGLPVCSPEQVRQRWRRDLDTVCAELTVPEPARRRWLDWLADDGCWPRWSVLTHGELYPAHVLVDPDDRITGVLDWTTAEVGDPARDLAMQHALAPPAAFDRTLEVYRAAGGRVWPRLVEPRLVEPRLVEPRLVEPRLVEPRLVEHCARLWSTAPIGYALFALQTGDAAHRSAAQAGFDDLAPG